MKFSIIVPVYNVEKYLKKCLDSVLNQTYQNFELIIVNDGSPDNSQKIIDEYVNKYPQKIKAFIKPNGGLSDARNYGLQYATGDYLIFVDSDDYIKADMLEVLKNNITDNDEVIGYNLITVDEKYNMLQTIKRPKFDTTTGENALKILIEGKECFEPACVYSYSLKYWNKNHFKFENGRYHEDFGLIPEVILKAKKVKQLDYDGYYYLQNSNSITKNSKTSIKKAYDVLFYYKKLKEISNTINSIETKMYLNSYTANAVILKIDSLNSSEKKKYIEEILKEKVCDDLLSNTLKRKIKKVFLKIKLKLSI